MDLPVPDIAQIARDAPFAVRLGAGLGAAALLTIGAKIYRPALYLGAFGVGGAIAAGILWGISPVFPVMQYAGPAFLLVIGLGGAAAAITAAAHRYGLVFIGFVTGGICGAAAGAFLGGGLYGPVGASIGGAIGAVLLPWLYEKMLPVTTSVVGAALAAFALGQIDQAWVIGAFAVGGSLFQLVVVTLLPNDPADDPPADDDA